MTVIKESKYSCETCNKPCHTLYGNKVNNKFTYQCERCTFKKK